jgi:hypothetical protein
MQEPELSKMKREKDFMTKRMRVISQTMSKNQPFFSLKKKPD